MEEGKYIIDRIEGDYVILEGLKGNIINVKKTYMNEDVKEGYVLYKKDNIYYIDEEATKIRKEKINELMKGLWEE